jgi:hypothetical protein
MCRQVIPVPLAARFSSNIEYLFVPCKILFAELTVNTGGMPELPTSLNLPRSLAKPHPAATALFTLRRVALFTFENSADQNRQIGLKDIRAESARKVRRMPENAMEGNAVTEYRTVTASADSL